MSITVAGHALREMAPRRRWSRNDGWQTVRSWVGTSDEINGLAAQFVSTVGADQVEVFPDPPLARLEVYLANEDNQTEIPVDTWELLGNDLTKGLLEHPKLMKHSDSTHSTISAGVRAVSDATPSQVEAEKTAARTAITAAVVLEGKLAAQAADALAIFTLMLKGTEAFSVSQYVLRKTSIVSTNYAANVGFSGIGNRWTTAQLLEIESVPAGIQFSINEIPVPATVQNGYVWSWLKRTPTVRSVARNKIEMALEWWLEAWAETLYDDYTPA